MFLPISIFINNLFLAIFQFLLLGAFGSALSIYSRFGGHYANSIRWSHSGGYLEMLTCLYKSSKIIPASASVALIATIIGSILAKTADLAASRLIHPDVGEIPQKNITLYDQTLPFPTTTGMPFDWDTWMSYDDNITHVMTSIINNTRTIPDHVGSRLYLPKIDSTNSSCDKFRFALVDANYNNFKEPTVNLLSGGCAEIFLNIEGLQPSNATSFSIKNISNDQWSVNSPIRNYTDLINNSYKDEKRMYQMEFQVGYTCKDLNHCQCDLITAYRSKFFREQNGLSAYPRTYLSNCLYKNGGSITMTQTNTPFSSSLLVRSKDLKTVAEEVYDIARYAAFTDPDEVLLRRMASSIREVQPSKVGAYELMEIQSSNNTINVLTCLWYTLGGTPNVSGQASSIRELEYFCNCMYTVFNVEFRNQVLNPLLSSRMNELYGTNGIYALVDMAIDHIKFNGSELAPTSITLLKSKTSEATLYRAAIGQNLIVKHLRGVITIFEITDYQTGLDIPEWLLILLITTMAICAVFWAITQLKLSERYTSSMYKMVTIVISSQDDKPYPILRQSQVDPFNVDGFPVISEAMYEMDADDSSAALMTLKSDQDTQLLYTNVA